MVITIRLLLILLTSMAGVTAFADVTVKLERNQIHINETVRLQIESNTAGESQPDLSPLEQHFRIIGRTSGQNISIVNGQQSVVRRWTIDLEPKSVGSFSIDPILLGSEQSDRFRIAVLPATNTASAGAEVFIEVETDSDTVYVQQQLRLTVRLFLRTRLLDGSLSDPEPENALVRRIGQDIRYETKRADSTYSVFERQYAIFPQKSGALEIPPFRFQGLAQDRTQSNQQMFNSLFNQGRRIRANSSAIKVDVTPPEASYIGTNWLPAKKLQIEQVGQPVDEFEVGKPVTLKIQLQALGLTAEQLPEVIIPDTPGLRSYPDQGIFETQDDGSDVVGIQLKSIALIPNEAGELALPDIEINWWNTETSQTETARLTGQQILVRDAPGSTRVAKSNLENAVDDTDTDRATGMKESSVATDLAETTASPGFWKWLALASLALWLLSVSIWVSTRIREKVRLRGARPDKTLDNKKQSESYWRNQIRSACQENNPSNARAAILRWGRALYGPGLTLDQIAEKVADPELERAIRDLDRLLYASQSDHTEWNGVPLWRSVSSFNSPPPSKSHHTEVLQPLYP